MYLTKDEEKAIKGESGETIALAYRILLAIGEATDAEKLVPIEWAHVSGVNYNTIGDAGVRFLEEFSNDARTSVKTTINPMGFDRRRIQDLHDERFILKQMAIVKSYERIGAIPSFTCIPYEIFDIPPKGTFISFSESNAAVFSNSLLGLLTNKESALSALASSVIGKTPYSDLRMDSFRHPKIAIKPDFDLSTELDYGLLGYFAGKVVSESCVAFEGSNGSPSLIKSKALCAGIGTSGSCGMFTMSKNSGCKEVISCGNEEISTIKDELNTSEDGDIIAFGSPQLGMNELNLISQLVEHKKFTKRCMIFCPRSINVQATMNGITKKIEKAGAEFICDCCICLTPLITKENADSVITNSVKAAYYLNRSNKLTVALKDLENIMVDYTEAR
jgi:predicted aconitase